MTVQSRSIEIYGTPAEFYGAEDDANFGNLGLFAARSRVLVDQLDQIPHDATILDVGMQSGVSTVVAGRSNPARSVVAIGPVKQRCDALRMTVRANGLANCRVLNAVPGQGGMFHQVSVEPETGDVSHARSFDAGQEGRVPGVALDAIVDAFDIRRIDLLNIEWAGFEMEILAGASRSIARFSPRMIVLVQPYASVKSGVPDWHGAARFAIGNFGGFTAHSDAGVLSVSNDSEFTEYARQRDVDPVRMDYLVFGGRG
jgi:FkbM family methyltransferase